MMHLSFCNAVLIVKHNTHFIFMIYLICMFLPSMSDHTIKNIESQNFGLPLMPTDILILN